MKFYNTHPFVKASLALVVAVTMTGCSTIEQTDQSSNRTASIALPAADQPQEYVTGTEFHWITDGENVVSKVANVEDGLTTAKMNNGCEWTFQSWSFAPLLEWKNCNGSTETRELRKSKGSPWPMQVGNSWSHSYTTNPEYGTPARLTYRCEVKSAEIVSVPAGEFKAFKVDCGDRSTSKTYWFTDEHDVGIVKTSVTRNGTTSTSEFEKMMPPQ